jgi:hypothetical protein
MENYSSNGHKETNFISHSPSNINKTDYTIENFSSSGHKDTRAPKATATTSSKGYGESVERAVAEKTEAEESVVKALEHLRAYRNKPLTNADIVLVMQGWNKALAFKTAFSEALLIYWRILCCETTREDSGDGQKSESAMNLVEKNKDPIYKCLKERIADTEELLMGLLDGAIRSMCPAHQIVQREAYRPIIDNVIAQRAQRAHFSLECETVQDYLGLFARCGITPQHWLCFINAVIWTMKTHAPYAQENDIDDLEQGPVSCAFGRAIALKVAIPAVETYGELVSLYKAPVVNHVQTIWNRFSETDRADFGEAFYRKLLSDHPELLDYFYGLVGCPLFDDS